MCCTNYTRKIYIFTHLIRAYLASYFGGTPSQETGTIPLAVNSSRTVYTCHLLPIRKYVIIIKSEVYFEINLFYIKIYFHTWVICWAELFIGPITTIVIWKLRKIILSKYLQTPRIWNFFMKYTSGIFTEEMVWESNQYDVIKIIWFSPEWLCHMLRIPNCCQNQILWHFEALRGTG